MLKWLKGLRRAELEPGEDAGRVEVAVEPAADPEEFEEKWEWEARRSYVRTIQNVDIGEYPYENAQENQTSDHPPVESHS
jgi:hypothetical protein